jgi:hypothetical protein
LTSAQKRGGSEDVIARESRGRVSGLFASQLGKG